MNNINTSFKKIHSLLILTFLCFLILINKTYSEEKIGSVVALKGEIIAINTDDEKRTLDIYDDIFLFDEIVTNNSSSITIQYDDNSTVIIKPSSSITVTEFVFSIEKKKFLGIVKKGKVIIESGKIAKNPEGSMEIQLPTMILGIRGTRFNMKINPDGSSEVGLSEDSFGEVGTINISSDGKVQTLYDTDQVISANIETGISERPKTDDEKKELVDASNELIEASFIDDNLIQEKLEEKLANGNLLDANNDGIIDFSDIDIIKENIKIEKQENINFIAENSTGDNTEFLSNVLNISDEASIGQSMNHILETNDYLVASVITNLSDEDNTFLTTSNLEANNVIKEKIFTQMLSDTDDDNNNIAVIGSIFAKSDADNVALMMDTIQTVGETNADSTLALEVLSSMADSESFYDMDFGNEGDEEYFGDEVQEQFNQMMEQAVFSAADSEDGAMMLANMMTHGSEESIYMMMDTIQTVGETNADSILALEVLSSMADSESFYDMDFGDEGQEQYDQMMEQAVFSAADSDDGAMMLANMMTHGSEESIYMMMDNIGMMSETNADSTLALEVLSSMADSESFYDMDFGDEGQEQYDQMMEQAVFSAADSEDGAMMLANMMTHGSEESIYMMMDTIQTVGETNADSTLALEVLSSMADSESFYDMDFGDEGQEQFNQMMEQAVFSAADSEDGAMMLANIMTEADADTVGMMFDYISDVSENDKYSTLGAEVLSSVASTAATNNEYFDTEKMDQLYDFIDTTTYTTITGDDGIADDMYDASGFAMMPPYYHRDTGTFFDNDGFDIYGNSQDDTFVGDDMYDASGFAMMPPYYHRDTGTFFDNDGFDIYGNSDPGAGGSYDANGFDFDGYHRETKTLYDYGGFDRDGYHRNTGTFYDNAGLDRYGNTDDAAGSDPTWNTEPTFDSSYTTSDSINISASASSSPVTNGIDYSDNGTLPSGVGIDGGTGDITGTPDTVAEYNVVITATDSVTAASISTASVTVNITAAGSDPTWNTEPTFDSSYTTSDSINISASASSSPVTNGITYDDNDTLPSGVGIDGGTGDITGTPDTVAEYNVVITATDSVTAASISTASATVNITAAGSDPTWNTEPTFDSSYTTSDSINISASASSSPVTNGITYDDNDTLPSGVGIDGGTGDITGTPDTVAEYNVVITATDSVTAASISTASATVNITAAGSDPTWNTEPTFDSSYTTSDSINISASASSSPVTNGITYDDNDTLPSGVGIDGGTGDITGTPDTVAEYNVVITATDSVTAASISTASATVNITAAGSDPTWNTEPTFDSSYTTSDSINISASASSSPVTNGITYDDNDTLPSGVGIDGGTGDITGTPDTVAEYNVVITATDSVTAASISTASATVNITAAGSDPTWNTEPTFDSSYTTSDSINISASASSSPVTNGITYDDNDTLPSGVGIDGGTGDITGTPDTVAEYNVVITATDSVTAASISTASVTVNITAAGSYDARGFSTVTPFHHKNTGNLYDDDGYNASGWTNAVPPVYNYLYDDNISP